MEFDIFKELEEAYENSESLPKVPHYTQDEALAKIEADPDLKAMYDELLPLHKEGLVDYGFKYGNFFNIDTGNESDNFTVAIQWFSDEDNWIAQETICDTLEDAICIVKDIEDLEGQLAGTVEIQEEVTSTSPAIIEDFTEDFPEPTKEDFEATNDWDEEDELVPPELNDEGIVNICKSLYDDDKSAVAFVKDTVYDRDGNRLEFVDWVYELCDAFQLNCGIKTSVEIYNAIMHDKRFMAVLRADFDKLNQAE